MSVTIKDVEHIAKLAKLEFSDTSHQISKLKTYLLSQIQSISFLLFSYTKCMYIRIIFVCLYNIS